MTDASPELNQAGLRHNRDAVNVNAMGGLTEIAGTILADAFRRSEVAAQNLTNMTTPGYKAQRWFPALIASEPVGLPDKTGRSGQSVDFSQGQMQNTGNPYDLAIAGSGFFVVRSDEGTFYTRDGQFSRGADGRIVTPNGLALQSASGGDVVVAQGDPNILADGTVLENGQPASRIAVANFSDLKTLQPRDDGLFSAPDGAESDSSAQIRQGMLETSNVSTAGEMVSIMASLRSAESGQKMLQVYDDLMARVIGAFGQA